MASPRAALLFSLACALLLAAQARPLELDSSDSGSDARSLLATTTEPCCSLYKKTAGDLVNISSQAKALAAQQSDLIFQLINQPAIKQSTLNTLTQANAALTDDGSKLYNNACLTQTQANSFGSLLLYERAIKGNLDSLNTVSGIPINVLDLTILGIPLQSFGYYLTLALQNVGAQADSIAADLTASAKALNGCSA